MQSNVAASGRGAGRNRSQSHLFKWNNFLDKIEIINQKITGIILNPKNYDAKTNFRATTNFNAILWRSEPVV